MKIQAQIEGKLSDGLTLSHVEVTNESHMHNVPAGSESHFKLVLVAQEFEGLTLVARHKMIYQLLAEELKNGVHALALHTYSAADWDKKQGRVPDSPQCHGGSKQDGAQQDAEQ